MSRVSKVVSAGRALQSDPTLSSSLTFWARPFLGLPPIAIRGSKIASPVMGSQGSKKPVIVLAREEEIKELTGMNELSSDTMKLSNLQLQSQSEKRTTRNISPTLRVEMIVERGVVGCRSFAMLAVAGSLIGSILCFVEGCFYVLESFLEFFKAVTQMLNSGGIIQLLIQAMSMFLVGTTLLTFGMSIYVMFIESNEKRRRRSQKTEANKFGLFNLNRLSKFIQIQSVSQAISRIGQAVVLVLQAEMVSKFRNIPLASGLDLACFAGALLTASTTVFLLSRLTTQSTKNTIW